MALALAASAMLQVLLSPFCKVEESFGLQALHDALLLPLGAPVAAWDHASFPGVVPRTFAGAAPLGFLLRPAASLLLRVPGCALADLQLLVRAALALVLLASLRRMGRAADAAFGRFTGACFLLTTAAQFHLPFYMSRPLPNTWALALVANGYASWLAGRPRRATAWIAAAIAVFRCDVAVVAVPIGAVWLLQGRIRLQDGVAVGLISALAGVALTAPLDSWLWQRALWPELEVFRFNVLANGGQNSAAWGVMPRLWYLTSALPRALSFTFPVALLSPLADARVLPYWGAALASISLYSLLPHKELRFIFPAILLLNLAAGAAAARALRSLFAAKKGRRWSALPGALACAACLGATLATTVLFSAAARHNYPGGHALRRLHELRADDRAPRRVHIDVAAAQQGVSRFGEAFREGRRAEGAPWTYHKDEDLSTQDMDRFDYVLTSAPGALAARGFVEIHRERCFAGVDARRVMRSMGACVLADAGAADSCFRLGRDGCDISVLERERGRP